METLEQYGTPIKWGMEKMTTGVAKSGSVKISFQTKELVGNDGNPVTVQRYKLTGEVSLECAFPSETALDAIESECVSYLSTKVSAAGLPEGGTLLVSSIDISENSEDFTSYSVSATYYPTVVTATA